MAVKLTNVIGYFNPNEYVLQLSISEFNMILQVKAKDYVWDRHGAMVNDPLLDRFVGKGKLIRYSDPKQKIELTALRPINDPIVAPGEAHIHSVTQAERFETKNGRVVPVAMPSASAPAPTPPPISYNPVKAYTVEEAKSLRLIKPTRPVPEDFGAEETTGAPRSGQEIPTIAYARDTTVGRKPKPLPAELTVPVTPEQQAIVAGLERAAQIDPESPNVLSQTARASLLETMPRLPKPVLDEVPAQRPVLPPSMPPRPSVVAPTPMIPISLPKPVLDEPGIVAETELPGQQDTQQDTADQVAVDDAVDAARRVPAPPVNDDAGGSSKLAVICSVCNRKKFSSVGLLRRHVRSNHPDQEANLLAPYTA